MHNIEPYYNWRHLYTASEDERSPFYGREYSEFEFSHFLYNYAIHPQWDSFGSATLYLKILFTDYDHGYTIIELLGEWNDCLYNDVMYLYEEVIIPLIDEGINKFILIGENILNFHYSDDAYYQEWYENIDEGWIVFVNFREHVLAEVAKANIDYYVATGGVFNEVSWRTMVPGRFFTEIESRLTKRLGM